MGWGEEHGAGTADVLAAQQCQWCKSWHSGRCPQVRAIEFHENGMVKRVEFVAETPLPHSVLRPDNNATGHVVKPSSTFAPDIAGRDMRMPLPSVGP